MSEHSFSRCFDTHRSLSTCTDSGSERSSCLVQANGGNHHDLWLWPIPVSVGFALAVLYGKVCEGVTTWPFFGVSTFIEFQHQWANFL